MSVPISDLSVPRQSTQHPETLFEDCSHPALQPSWKQHWVDMPEYEQLDLKPESTITVQFRNAADREDFLKLLGESPTRVKSIWYPQLKYLKQSQRAAPALVVDPNRYPVYVISKGRWETPLTVNALERLGIPYHVVIEPQEWPHYAAVIHPDKILTLPFSNLGQGSIPARNWVWEHSLTTGARRHWILDDNMDGFYRLHQNLKQKVVDCNPFTPLEQFVDRFENVAIAGMNYEFFADRRSVHPPFVLNTRVYSCILIQNDIPYRWRGRYNEDTDLCIRALKDGWCTVLFNAYLAKKMPTMKMAGGNTDELYAEDGRLRMAESLREQHPDIVTVTEKWGRPQHQVDYRRFKRNALRPLKVTEALLTLHPETLSLLRADVMEHGDEGLTSCRVPDGQQADEPATITDAEAETLDLFGGVGTPDQER